MPTFQGTSALTLSVARSWVPGAAQRWGRRSHRSGTPNCPQAAPHLSLPHSWVTLAFDVSSLTSSFREKEGPGVRVAETGFAWVPLTPSIFVGMRKSLFPARSHCSLGDTWVSWIGAPPTRARLSGELGSRFPQPHPGCVPLSTSSSGPGKSPTVWGVNQPHPSWRPRLRSEEEDEGRRERFPPGSLEAEP